ncbi:MAG: hypothetical protein ACE5FN_11415 [Leptospirillia bacterium]
MNRKKPVRYGARVTETICERLAAGESLVSICTDPAMPGYASVMRWLERYPAFRARYTAARTRQAHALADEVLGVLRDDALAPADKQARIKGLTWMAAKLHPVKYGERGRSIPGGPEPEDGPPRFTVLVKNDADTTTGHGDPDAA